MTLAVSLPDVPGAWCSAPHNALVWCVAQRTCPALASLRLIPPRPLPHAHGSKAASPAWAPFVARFARGSHKPSRGSHHLGAPHGRCNQAVSLVAGALADAAEVGGTEAREPSDALKRSWLWMAGLGLDGFG